MNSKNKEEIIFFPLSTRGWKKVLVFFRYISEQIWLCSAHYMWDSLPLVFVLPWKAMETQASVHWQVKVKHWHCQEGRTLETPSIPLSSSQLTHQEHLNDPAAQIFNIWENKKSLFPWRVDPAAVHVTSIVLYTAGGNLAGSLHCEFSSYSGWQN